MFVRACSCVCVCLCGTLNTFTCAVCLDEIQLQAHVFHPPFPETSSFRPRNRNPLPNTHTHTLPPSLQRTPALLMRSIASLMGKGRNAMSLFASVAECMSASTSTPLCPSRSSPKNTPPSAVSCRHTHARTGVRQARDVCVCVRACVCVFVCMSVCVHVCICA